MATPLMKRILFSTDFSGDAAHAQEYAVYLAQACESPLDVLHVIEAPSWLGVDGATIAVIEQARADATQRLEQVRDQISARGVSVRIRQVLGKPYEQICLAVKEQGADVAVLGVQGHTNLMQGLIGSTVDRVVKHASCQVLAVPGLRGAADNPSSGSRHGQIRRILAPVDFSNTSLDAVEYAFHLAKGLGAAVTLMHVLEPVYYDLECGLGMIEEESGKRDYRTGQLTELTGLAASLGLEAGFEISGGVPSDAILASALRHSSDLIVMGTQGRRSVSERRCGSVAEAVLRQTSCPVLTLKSSTFADDHRRVVPTAMAEKPFAS